MRPGHQFANSSPHHAHAQNTTSTTTTTPTTTPKKRPIRVGYVLITSEQLEEVMQKIFDEASFSVVSNSKNKKTAAGRKCPLCERRMGNFGPNYKNHVKKCCPVRAFLRFID